MATYLVDLENTGLAGLTGLEELSARDKVIVFYGTRTGSIAFDKHVELTKAKADVTYTKTERVAKNYLDFQLVTYLGYLIGSGQERVYYIISKDKGYDSCIEFWRKTDKQIAITRCESLQKQKTPAQAGVEKNGKATQTVVEKNGKAAQTVAEKNEQAAQVGAEKNEQAAQAVAEKNGQAAQAAGSGQASAQKAPNRKPPAQKAAKQKVSAQKASEKPTLPESMRKKIRKAVKDEALASGSYKFIYDYVVQSSDKSKLNVALVKRFQQEKGNRLYKEILDVFSEYHKQKA